MDEKGLLLKDQKVLFVKESKSKNTFFNQETFMFEFFFFFLIKKELHYWHHKNLSFLNYKST